MNKKLGYLGLLLILPVFTVALTSTWETLPVANALTSRSSFNDNHYTSLYPGGPRICGDHVCSPGEYDKMQQELAQAQMKGKPGTTPSTPPTTTPTTTTSSTSSAVCAAVKSTLTNANIS